MKTLIAVLVLMGALSTHGEDMQKYLSDTQDLIHQEKYQEALDRLVWFHDHALEHDPAMYGVRLSFALGYWKQLGDVYPPALEALKKTRDDKTALLENQKGNRKLFHDVMALNRTLGEDGRTVDLFRKLDQEQIDLAAQCWEIAKEAIIKAKAYDLARKYISNPVREFGKVKAKYDQFTARYGGKNFGVPFKAWNENNLVEETLRLIELALSLDDAKAAKDIQAEALTLLDDRRLRDAIPKERQEQETQPKPEGEGRSAP